VHGIDISHEFVDSRTARRAERSRTFARARRAEMRFDREFDAVICLCRSVRV
jgi:2-polyprenyl-3-methyl-5-hydroxy-6-metoxy-1,4-benzoquinol methylase